MKYNKALDYTVLAMQEMVNGKPVLAARLFAKATEQPDLQDAMRILEASNAQAFKKLQASKVEAPKTRLQAEAEGEVEVAEEPEVVEEDLEGDPLEQVADAIDGDDEVVDEAPEAPEADEEPVEESPALAVAKVLASMSRKAK